VPGGVPTRAFQGPQCAESRLDALIEPSRTVFLSYASQDSQSAKRISDALQEAGIVAWFDQNELKGGEVWDRQIRDRIHACRLFIAVVSANTEARDEGYFRREWKLAVDRTDDLAEDVPFLLPVVIDRTDQATARVPRRFREVQWATLRNGEVSNEFVSRIVQLLAVDIPSDVQHRGRSLKSPVKQVQIPAARKPRAKIRRFAVQAVIIMATAVFGFVEWAGRPKLSAPPAESTESSKVTSPELRERSLAVLPFVDMSEKHDQEYFADGMSEEILDLLVKIPGLTVIGRTSSFQFKGKNDDLKAIGTKLGASYVVEGSVRKSGARIRVTAQLIDTRSGAHLWSDSYDRDFGDTLLLQDQIATSVARTLQLAVISVGSVAGRPTSMDAYTLYLHGRVAFDRGDVAAFSESQSYFEQALDIDPSFARAAEGILLSYLNIVYAGSVSSRVGWPRVKQLAMQALRLDPSSTFAHSALSWFHYSYDYDWSACNAEIDTVLAAHTHDPITLLYAGYVAGATGRIDEGVRMIHEAIVFDPLSPDPYQALGGVLSFKGDHEGAVRAYRKSLEISPLFAGSHLYIGESRLAQGRPQDALPEINAEVPGASRDAMLAATYFVLGRKRESDVHLAGLLKSTDEGRAYWTAIAYAYRQENDRAFEWLDKAYIMRDLSLSVGRTDYLAQLHSDRRWKALLRKMNIPE
jgi:TolB-like protein/tetratricopeptide (TPR) repeat protein